MIENKIRSEKPRQLLTESPLGVLDEWPIYVNEQIDALNNKELFPDGYSEILSEFYELQNKHGLSREQMEVALDSFMVLGLKLPPERDKRKSIKLEEIAAHNRLQNYLRGEIERT